MPKNFSGFQAPVAGSAAGVAGLMGGSFGAAPVVVDELREGCALSVSATVDQALFFTPLTIAPTTAVTIAPVTPPPTNCPAKAPMSRPAPESAGG